MNFKRSHFRRFCQIFTFSLSLFKIRLAEVISTRHDMYAQCARIMPSACEPQKIWRKHFLWNSIFENWCFEVPLSSVGGHLEHKPEHKPEHSLEHNPKHSHTVVNQIVNTVKRKRPGGKAISASFSQTGSQHLRITNCRERAQWALSNSKRLPLLLLKFVPCICLVDST